MGRSRSKRGVRPSPAALATWHRRLGIATAVLVAWLAASGFLLNHTEAIGLDERYAGAPWLLDWYGIERPQHVVGFRVGDHWVTQVGERVYFDTRTLPGDHDRLAGAAVVRDEVAIATDARILLLAPDGRLAETLGAVHGVPAAIERVGVQDGHLLVQTRSGAFAAGAALTRWRTVEPDGAEWARAAEVPAALRSRLMADYRGRLLTLERVLLDLHSGRLLGEFGVLLMDLAAVAFLLLAVTGLWMWLVRNNGRGSSAGRRK